MILLSITLYTRSQDAFEEGDLISAVITAGKPAYITIILGRAENVPSPTLLRLDDARPSSLSSACRS
jgi:hypothetical protein